MLISFSKTEKSKPVLIEGGFDYIVDRTAGEKVYWRCTQSKKKKCKARLHTTNNTICHRVGNHSHSPNPNIDEIRQCRSEMRDLSATTTMPTHLIVAKSIATASPTTLSQLPPISALKRTICRRRARRLNPPAVTTTTTTITSVNASTLTNDSRIITERLVSKVDAETLTETDMQATSSFSLALKDDEELLQYESANQDSDMAKDFVDFLNRAVTPFHGLFFSSF